MMGSENEEGAHPLAPSDEMETLILDDPLSSSKSFANYKSALISLSDSHNHPLSPSIVAKSVGSDPLLGPLHEEDQIRPKEVDFSSHFEDSDDYSDVFDSPITGGIGGGGNNGVGSPKVNSRSFSRSESLGSEYLNITVLNPQKEHEVSSNSIVPGGNTYVTYLISTKTNMRGFGGSDFSVRRRFKDVVTLSDRLSESYRGFFIAPRPDKSVVESQVMHKQEFVEQRRGALEKYLRKLAAHPVIRTSDELRVFLQVQGKLPLPTSTDVASRMLDGAVNLPKQLFGDSRSAVAPHEAVQPAKGGRDLLRLFKELKQSVTNDWGNSRPAAVEEDKEFLEKKEKLFDFENRLTDVSKQAESLVKAQQDMGDTMGELGLSFIKLTKFENEAAILGTQRTRATEMKNIATATVRGSRMYRELTAKTVKNLDTLHEYLGVMLAAHNAYSDRANALLTVQTLLSEVSSLQSRAEKLEAASSRVFGSDKTRNHKLEELKETMKITEDSKNCAVREYERIKENNRTELERLEREKHTDFLKMLKGFVNNQREEIEIQRGEKGSREE
ncbi:sorting nexin 2B isoform X2 [Spinacia oleracea]|uniref:Sorting nexin 2B isoform X2 n=1 Tax=Spinacia oleracea TaxID=3562 RepID=A0A9R0JT41_SPIOL|nr:sorting nexin 2B-like isoform X2 [Spinacia oleracea]